MVGLDVVADEIVDFFQRNERSDLMTEIHLELGRDGVEQGDLFVHDQIGIICRTLGGSRIAVKIMDVPVHDSDPVDVFLDFGDRQVADRKSVV